MKSVESKTDTNCNDIVIWQCVETNGDDESV